MAPVVIFVLGGAAAWLAPRFYKDSIKLAITAKNKTISTVDRIKEDIDDAQAEVNAERSLKSGRQHEPANATAHSQRSS